MFFRPAIFLELEEARQIRLIHSLAREYKPSDQKRTFHKNLRGFSDNIFPFITESLLRNFSLSRNGHFSGLVSQK